MCARRMQAGAGTRPAQVANASRVVRVLGAGMGVIQEESGMWWLHQVYRAEEERVDNIDCRSQSDTKRKLRESKRQAALLDAGISQEPTGTATENLRTESVKM